MDRLGGSDLYNKRSACQSAGGFGFALPKKRLAAKICASGVSLTPIANCTLLLASVASLFFYSFCVVDLRGYFVLERSYIIAVLSLYAFCGLRYGLTSFASGLSAFHFFSIFFTWIPLFAVGAAGIYAISAEVAIYALSASLLSTIWYELAVALTGGKIGGELFAKARSRILLVYKITYWRWFGYFALGLSLFFTSLFLAKAGGVPLLAVDPESARVAAMKGAGTIHRASFINLQIGAVTLAIVDVVRYGRPTFVHIVAIVACAGFNMLTGPRADALFAVLLVYVVYEMLRFDRLRTRSGMVIAGSLFAIIALVGGVRYAGVGGFNWMDTWVRFINRLYMNPVNAERIMDFFYGRNIDFSSFLVDLRILLPGSQKDLGTFLKDLMHIEFDGGGITVPIYAEGYLNGGVFGVIGISFVFAMLARCCEIFAFLQRSPVVGVGAAILLAAHLMGVATMGVSGMVVKNIAPIFVIGVSSFGAFALVWYVLKGAGVVRSRLSY